MFCGPTGVGKTETAVMLADILGGGRKALLRVDCNTLQGSGRDSGPAMNRLLGPAPGYIGYVRGQGGLLSKIRDMADSVVLFDEIEKADPGVGQIILQILDTGQTEDNDGSIIDFRRAFIIFTTNAGASYEREHRLGFTEGGEASTDAPRVDVEEVKTQLRATGHGEEFLGRHIRYFVFTTLDASAVDAVIEKQLNGLRGIAEERGYEFAWDTEVHERVSSRWQPRFGVRHLTTILRHRIREQLSIADAQGELKGIRKIRLRVMEVEGLPKDCDLTGLAKRERQDETLIIYLA
jgi:ATP-dependent Clp protease ATP-binding subunit ClpA